MECNRVERHVGRLSLLTTVSPVLMQTETWRGEDYSRLLEHPSEKALQRRYYAKHAAISKVLFVRVEPSRTWHLVPHPSVFLFSGGGKQGFMEDIYQLAFPNINSKQMIRMPKSVCVEGAGAELCTGAPTQAFLSPQRLCLEWMISSPTKGLSWPCHWGDKKPSLHAEWRLKRWKYLYVSARFSFYEANTRPWSSALSQWFTLECETQSPQGE